MGEQKEPNKEEWVVREIKKGDILRVHTGRFYHFGIYIGDEEVIHFAGPDMSRLTDAESAVVRQDSLAHFSMGKPLEVRDFSLKEKIKKRSVKKIIEEAKNSLGTGGYDIIYNNCEHFVNRCVFGIAFSTQIEELRKMIK
ncbi:MAG: lecithin retinol acyltransferase family protein [Lachnospiraceae bacterium]|nr:lecithin retinol acyltransferase family protein [Lachnospiraceae bacterium]